MAYKGQDLLALIAGTLRPSVKSAQLKSAGPAVVSADVDDNKYSRSVAKDQEEAARRVAEEAKANQPKVTGNAYYDSLPSTVAQNKAEEDARIWDEYAKKQNITQRNSFEDTMRGHKDFKSWGDALLPERGYREDGKTTGAVIRNGLRDFRDDFAHDTLNNFHMFANNMGRGAEELARFGAKYLDPRSWGSSTKARLNRLAHDNAAANSRAGYLERDRRILESMDTGLGANEIVGGKGVSTADKWLSRLNYATRAGGGQFIGGDLVTLGAGSAARGAGSGIQAGAKAVGTRAGQAIARSSMPLSRQAGNLTSSGIQAVGDAAAMPFNAAARLAGAAHNPAETIKSVAKPVGQTIAATWRPVRDVAHVAMNPRASASAAWNFAKAHPFKATWNVGAYPVRTAWNIAKPTASALWRNQMPIYYGSEMVSAGNGLAAGNMGETAGAAGRVTGYKLLSRINPWFSAVPIAYGAYQGMSGGDESPYEN